MAVYSFLFFDFDGTLYDTVEGITKCVRYALQKRGLEGYWQEGDAATDEMIPAFDGTGL